MNKSDWWGYENYLRSQIVPQPKEANRAASIGEAFNNYMLSVDIADVREKKLGLKPKAKKDAKGKA